MSKFKVIGIGAIFSILPSVTTAACTDEDYTVVFVNGIETTLEQAKEEKKDLKNLIPPHAQGQAIDVELGYNATHLSSVGDKIESLFQSFNSSISDFDLNTILMQMHDEVHTRKVLLVGHSQGSFYTNTIYRYLITHGMSPESVAVYNIATPASYVAAGGRYITSSNDKAINLIRDTEVNGNIGAYVNSYYTYKGSVIESPLRANFTIPKESGWESDDYGGHHFAVYMNGAGDRIVSDIDAALSKLKPSGNSNDCFTAPRPDVKYKMQAAAFTAGEPLLQAGQFAISTALSPVDHLLLLGSSAFSVLQNSRGALAGILGNENQTASASVSNSSADPAPPVPVNPDLAASAIAEPKTAPTNPSSPAPTPAQPLQIPPATVKEPAPFVSVPESARPLFSVQPGFGGSGGFAPVQSAVATATPPTPKVTFTILAPLDNAILATTSATFSGTTDAGATVTLSEFSAIASTTADTTGAWSLSSIFSEGAHALTFLASLAGKSDTSISRSLTVDAKAPGTTTISIAACMQSISSSFCALPSATTDVTWTAVVDADYHGVSINGAVAATTTALTLNIPLTDNATSTIAVVSYDAAGNTATSTSIDVYAISRPLIFNEVGWGGNLGFTTDIIRHSNQWIELKSLAPFAIDLSKFKLRSATNAPISLTGSLDPSDPYAGLEATDMDLPIQRQITAFTLATTSAEQLTLVWDGAVVDSTPAASTCATWCAGAYEATLGTNVSGRVRQVTPLSMERIADSSEGTLAASWKSTNSYETYWGSLAEVNSRDYPDAGVYCSSPDDVLQDDRTFKLAPAGHSIACMFLTKFITPGTFGATRVLTLFRGEVGSSTLLVGHTFSGSIAVNDTIHVPSDAIAGDRYFFSIWEERPFGRDTTDFINYFTASASTTLGYTAPHGNYVALPFTYEP